MIKTEKNGFVDANEIASYWTEFIIGQKKAILFILLKSGARLQWNFDSTGQRDKVVAEIDKQKGKVVKIDLTIIS